MPESVAVVQKGLSPAEIGEEISPINRFFLVTLQAPTSVYNNNYSRALLWGA